jgi:hypothetical protein
MTSNVADPICRCGHASEDHTAIGCSQAGCACVEYRPARL